MNNENVKDGAWITKDHLREDGFLIKDIKEPTYKQCTIAVRSQPKAIEYIDVKHHDKKMATIVLKACPSMIRYFDIELINDDLLEYMVSESGCLDLIPDERKTRMICHLSVGKSGNSLKYVPEKYKSFGLCRTAIRDDNYAIKHVPDSVNNRAFCKYAVMQNPCVLEDIPHKWRDYDLYSAMVDSDPLSIVRVPSIFRKSLESSKTKEALDVRLRY